MGLGKTYSTKYLVDSNNNTGAVGEVLVSTATGINWANGSDIVGGPYLPLAGGTMTGTAGIIFPDDFKLNIGTGSDLQIYHNGTNDYIVSTGTYNIFEANNHIFRNLASNEDYAKFIGNGGVELYYNNVKKFETTSTGATVSGALAVDGKITNLTAGTGNLDAVNVQQLNDATTGALIFKGTWSASPTTTSSTLGTVTTSTTVVISSPNAAISVGATVTGGGLPANITVTAISANGVTLTISSAQSIADATALAFSTPGGIPDLSQAARKVTGNYYICETAGVATPNGTGTTPDDWAVGDWVAFSDLATDAWQKIDNSSVLSGAGTGGTVPVWAGSGTSVTLADSPITVSGSDVTFAGNIVPSAENLYNIGSAAVRWEDIFADQVYGRDLYVDEYIYHNGDTNTYIRFTADTQTFRTGGDDRLILTNSLATLSEPLLIDGVLNYTGLEIKGSGASRPQVTFTNATQGILGQIYGTESNALIIATGTSEATALTLDSSQNATFAEDVTVKGSHLYIWGDNTAVAGSIQAYTSSGGLYLEASGTNQNIGLIPSGTGTVNATTSLNVGSYTRAAQTTVSILSDAQQNSILKFREDDDLHGFTLGYYGAPNDFVITRHDGSSTGVAVMSIPRASSNVTFTGTVTAPTFIGDLNGTINTATTGATQTAGNNSTLIATTAYADAAAAAVPIGSYLPLAGGTLTGNLIIESALLSNQENTDVDTGAETVASVLKATYTAAFFDFVIKEGTNLRAGTVFACHDGTNVVYTETSTNDLGDTSDVTLSVDISGTDMRLRATVTSDDWIIKSLIRAI